MGDETVRYTPYVVRGSAALELDCPTYEESYEMHPGYPQVQDASRPRHGTAAHARAAERVRPSLITVVGVVILSFLCVLMLLGNVRVTAVSAASVELEQQLAALEKENDVLKIQYENTFHLKEIETYATKTLGMSRLKDSQITVLPSEGENRAEILCSGDAQAADSVLQEAGTLAEGIKAFFVR